MYKYLHQLLEAQKWLREPGVIAGDPRDIPAKERRRLIVEKGQKCAYCGTMDNPTIDHKLARVLGGTNERGNLQVLCRPCNQAKNQEEIELLKMLHSEEGRAELLRQWDELRQAGAERGQQRKAARIASKKLAMAIIKANREAERNTGPTN